MANQTKFQPLGQSLVRCKHLMPFFTIHPIPTVAAPNEVMELGIDGRRPLDKFLKAMRKAGDRKDLVRLQTWLGDLAQGNRLPPKAFKKLRGQDPEDDWEEYELRIGRYRFYLFFQPPNRRIVVLGELKKNVKGKENKEQRGNIDRLRTLKAAYRDQVLAINNEEE